MDHPHLKPLLALAAAAHPQNVTELVALAGRCSADLCVSPLGSYSHWEFLKLHHAGNLGAKAGSG